MPNKAIELTALRAAAHSHDGADASRRAIVAADYHPLSARRFAPAIKRMKLAGGLARTRAALPQLIRSHVSKTRERGFRNGELSEPD